MQAPAVDPNINHDAQGNPKRTKRGKRRYRSRVDSVEAYVNLVPVLTPEELQVCWRPVGITTPSRVPGVAVSADGLSITGSKGYRTVQATLGAQGGTWYFEVGLAYLGPTGHCRLGWAQGGAESQAPVGYDGYGYAYRDVDGAKIGRAYSTAYGQPFRQGQVVGCLLHLGDKPPAPADNKQAVMEHRGERLVKDLPTPPPRSRPIIPGSFISFTCDGVCQGVAFRDLKAGRYFPALSLFTRADQAQGATATFNFGPRFHYRPPVVEGMGPLRPVSDLAGAPPPGYQGPR